MVRVHRPPGTAVELTLSGDMPLTRRARSAQIRVVSGGRELDAFAGTPGFVRRVKLPSAASDDCDVEIAIESTFSFVPHDEGRSGDRRELAFREFNLDVLPLPESK
jgi:hypothetical protein